LPAWRSGALALAERDVLFAAALLHDVAKPICTEIDLVFPSTKDTPMEAQNLVNRHFKAALRRAKLPADKIRFHDLRHAAASMFIALGYDARMVADMLGHSSPDFTLRQYAHSFEEIRQRAVADVGKLLRDEARVLELPPPPEKAREPMER
jgi:integrase